MKISIVINEHLSKKQLEHSYLLCLAGLNFEHQVNAVFLGQAFKLIMQDTAAQRQWLALKQYGIEAFYQLQPDNKHIDHETKKHCQIISPSTFDIIKSKMDLLL